MAYFDFLIDKNSNEPKNIEYIYRLDCVWKDGFLESFPIEKNTIVNNVKRLVSGRFEFTIKGSDEVLHCNYPWSLAENTPKNLERIRLYDEELVLFKLHEKKIEKLRNDIITLKIK